MPCAHPSEEVGVLLSPGREEVNAIPASFAQSPLVSFKRLLVEPSRGSIICRGRCRRASIWASARRGDLGLGGGGRRGTRRDRHEASAATRPTTCLLEPRALRALQLCFATPKAAGQAVNFWPPLAARHYFILSQSNRRRCEPVARRPESALRVLAESRTHRPRSGGDGAQPDAADRLGQGSSRVRARGRFGLDRGAMGCPAPLRHVSAGRAAR